VHMQEMKSQATGLSVSMAASEVPLFSLLWARSARGWWSPCALYSLIPDRLFQFLQAGIFYIVVFIVRIMFIAGVPNIGRWGNRGRRSFIRSLEKSDTWQHRDRRFESVDLNQGNSGSGLENRN
jgi:hypothetical protein